MRKIVQMGLIGGIFPFCAILSYFFHTTVFSSIGLFFMCLLWIAILVRDEAQKDYDEWSEQTKQWEKVNNMFGLNKQPEKKAQNDKDGLDRLEQDLKNLAEQETRQQSYQRQPQTPQNMSEAVDKQTDNDLVMLSEIRKISSAIADLQHTKQVLGQKMQEEYNDRIRSIDEQLNILLQDRERLIEGV